MHGSMHPSPAALPATPVQWKEGLPHSKSVCEIKWNCDGSYLISSGNDKLCKIGSIEGSGSVSTICSDLDLLQ